MMTSLQNLLILIATSATIAQLLYAVFLVPETCPIATRRPFAWQPSDLNPARSLAVFTSSSAMRWLAIAFALQTFAIQGTGSISQTFIVNSLDLTVAQQSVVGIIGQVSGIVVQARICIPHSRTLAYVPLQEHPESLYSSLFSSFWTLIFVVLFRSVLLYHHIFNFFPLSHRRR